MKLTKRRNTAIDAFGRIESTHAFSAANAFPYNKFHNLFIAKKHDLLEMSFEEFKDLLSLPMQW
jgi:hypothetical protein